MALQTCSYCHQMSIAVALQMCSYCYQMQIAMALQMSSHKEDPAAKRLRDQLNEAHTEIRTLTDHVQKLESSQVQSVCVVLLCRWYHKSRVATNRSQQALLHPMQFGTSSYQA